MINEPVKQGKQLNSDIGFILEDNFVSHNNKKKEKFFLDNEKINKIQRQRFKTGKINTLTSVIINGKTDIDNMNNILGYVPLGT